MEGGRRGEEQFVSCLVRQPSYLGFPPLEAAYFMIFIWILSFQISLKISENPLKWQKEKGKNGDREGKKKVPQF